MANQEGGKSTVAAAVILGLCILGAAVIVGEAAERASSQLIAGITEAVEDFEASVAAPPAPPARAEAPPRRGPDPDKRYEVNVAGAPSMGPADAEVTIVEFSDFQCPFCARVNPTLKQIRDEYGDQVRVVFKHLPLAFHSKAPAAHAASEAAHRQGKFWEMHDKIFANQREISEENYVVWAGEIGLDVEQFKKDSSSGAVKKKVDSDLQEAGKLGVSGTPGFFINGRFTAGAKPFSSFKVMIDEELEDDKG